MMKNILSYNFILLTSIKVIFVGFISFQKGNVLRILLLVMTGVQQQQIKIILEYLDLEDFS